MHSPIQPTKRDAGTEQELGEAVECRLGEMREASCQLADAVQHHHQEARIRGRLPRGAAGMRATASFQRGEGGRGGTAASHWTRTRRARVHRLLDAQ